MGQYCLTPAGRGDFIGNNLQDVFRLALTQFEVEMVIFSIQLTSDILVIWVSFGAYSVYINSTLLDEIPTKVDW